MTPWFVLSYPRSRTAWLSMFLTGAGVPCFHEAWKQTTTASGMRALMEAHHAPVVCNSDCSNVFFFDELRAEFPTAKFLRILSTPTKVVESLTVSYGQWDYTEMLQAYEAAFAHVRESRVPMLTVDCDRWDPDHSRLIVSNMMGRCPSSWWVEQAESMLVQLMPRQIARDMASGATGALQHIAERMRRSVWA